MPETWLLRSGDPFKAMLIGHLRVIQGGWAQIGHRWPSITSIPQGCHALVLARLLRYTVTMTDTVATIQKVQTRREVFRVLLDHEDDLREQGVQSLMLFGSAVRNEMHPDSDVDIVVNDLPDADWSLLDFVSVKLLLEDALGRDVHLSQGRALRPEIRSKVSTEGVEVFA